MRSDIQERANGRWHGVLSALGVQPDFLRAKHGPCPGCGGRDRFRWDNKEGRGTFYCSNCGAGDGFDLLKLVKGWDFKRAAEEVEAIVGTVKHETPRRIQTSEEKRAAMQKRWSECKPVEPDSAVARYLTRRIGRFEPSPVIRSAPDRPAMVALMQAPDGRATMVHTTFLTADGHKAKMDQPRLMMPGSIADGAAVRLAKHDGMLGIAEGLETALSATLLTGIPCWAALNAELMKKWQPPASVKRVVIFGDNDASFTGQAAAWHLAHRLAARKLDVSVRIPEQIGTDWNDVLTFPQPQEKPERVR
jgi:putative DNA primase/helicase